MKKRELASNNEGGETMDLATRYVTGAGLNRAAIARDAVISIAIVILLTICWPFSRRAAG